MFFDLPETCPKIIIPTCKLVERSSGVAPKTMATVPVDGTEVSWVISFPAVIASSKKLSKHIQGASNK
jgi:hypothetical protein